MKSPSYEIAVRFTAPEWRQIGRAARKRKIQPARYVIEAALCMAIDDLREQSKSKQTTGDTDATPWENGISTIPNYFRVLRKGEG